MFPECFLVPSGEHPHPGSDPQTVCGWKRTPQVPRAARRFHLSVAGWGNRAEFRQDGVPTMSMCNKPVGLESKLEPILRIQVTGPALGGQATGEKKHDGSVWTDNI